MNRRIISEVEGFTCNKHSLGFIDDKGELLEAQMLNSNYSETHSDILDRLGFDEDEIYDTPSRWIKVSNSSEFWFEGHDWYDVTPEQIDSMITVWKLCSIYSRWIKDETETKQLYFRCFGGLKRLTIAEFLKAYGSQEQIDNLYSTLLGESVRSEEYLMNKKHRNPFASSQEEIGQKDVPVEKEIMENTLRKYIRNMLLEITDAEAVALRRKEEEQMAIEKQEFEEKNEFAMGLVNDVFERMEKFWKDNYNKPHFYGYEHNEKEVVAGEEYFKKEAYEKVFLNGMWYEFFHLIGEKPPGGSTEYHSRRQRERALQENSFFDHRQLSGIAQIQKDAKKAQRSDSTYDLVTKEGEKAAKYVIDQLKANDVESSHFYHMLMKKYKETGRDSTGYFRFSGAGENWPGTIGYTNVAKYDINWRQRERKDREEAEWYAKQRKKHKDSGEELDIDWYYD